MALPGSTFSSVADHRSLIQELREYMENWGDRMCRAGYASETQAIAGEVFEDLLKQMLGQLKLINPLPRQIHDFIASNLKNGVTLQDQSTFLGYSEKYCSELFRNHMGESFSVYLKRVKIERAKCLIEDPSLSLAQIAGAVGFQDQFALSHFFKKATGFSPKQFRMKLLRKEGTTINTLPADETSTAPRSIP